MSLEPTSDAKHIVYDYNAGFTKVPGLDISLRLPDIYIYKDTNSDEDSHHLSQHRKFLEGIGKTSLSRISLILNLFEGRSILNIRVKYHRGLYESGVLHDIWEFQNSSRSFNIDGLLLHLDFTGGDWLYTITPDVDMFYAQNDHVIQPEFEIKQIPAKWVKTGIILNGLSSKILQNIFDIKKEEILNG